LNIIFTKLADCRDCHRCVRTCPTKAIGVENGQARVIDELCIMCGLCVRSCPQQAKVIVDNTDTVREWLQLGERVLISLAPSFAAAFNDFKPWQVFAALHKAGFHKVEETAFGALLVAEQYKQYMQDDSRPITISSCCPVAVNIVEKHFPQLISILSPTVSPMIAHARLLRAKEQDNVRVVFVGPCFAKITEALEQRGVDAVLTFQQLRRLLQQQRVVIEELTEEGCPNLTKLNTRMFAVSQGVLKSFLSAQQMYTQDVISAEGVEQCFGLFEAISRGEIRPRFVEVMACVGGCIGGPGIDSSVCTVARRSKTVQYSRSCCAPKEWESVPEINMHRRYTERTSAKEVPTEEQIKEILAQTRKFTTADEKNCGGCGYNTCRDKAIAVFQGMAEMEMCLPYMRMRAESLANIIVHYSVSGMIVVDENMIIREFNPAAERMFETSCSQIRGYPLALVMDDTDYIKAAATNKTLRIPCVEYPQLNLITDQKIIPVKQHGIVIGMIHDVTEREKRAKELEKVKDQAIQKATEIVNKQMLVAQEIAGLLGETTAETKAALLELISLYRGKEGR